VSVLQDAELCSGVPWLEDKGGEGHGADCECPHNRVFFWVQSLAALVSFCQFSGNVNDG
jgi:hypothetical protein